MNLPNKLTLSRIIMTILIIIILLFPFYQVGIEIPKYNVGGIIIGLEYVIAGVLFIIASVTDFLDGRIARSRHIVTDTGKMLDAIADKVLVNSVLIIFAAKGILHPIVPVIYIFRDEVVNALRMHSASKGVVVPAGITGKIKTACMMVGLTLMFFSNLPFELVNVRVDLFLIYCATILSVVSGVQYYNQIMKNK